MGRRQSVGAVEHALGAAQADTHGAKLSRTQGIIRRVGVRHHPQLRHFVRPHQQSGHFLGKFGLHRRYFTGVNMTSAAVNGNDIAFLQRGFTDPGIAQMVVNHNLIAARDTGLAHAARDHSGVRSLAAATGQNALCLEETVNILRLGFLAHQDNFFAGAAALFGSVGIKYNLAGSRAGRSRQPLCQ